MLQKKIADKLLRVGNYKVRKWYQHHYLGREGFIPFPLEYFTLTTSKTNPIPRLVQFTEFPNKFRIDVFEVDGGGLVEALEILK